MTHPSAKPAAFPPEGGGAWARLTSAPEQRPLRGPDLQLFREGRSFVRDGSLEIGIRSGDRV